MPMTASNTTTLPPAASPDALRERVAAFVAHYDRVHRERMADLPVTNPRLKVEGMGFEWAMVLPDADADPNAASASAATEALAADQTAHQSVTPVIEGVLITPWFMNLVRLPLAIEPARQRVGRKFVHRWGKDSYEFIGGHDDAIGYHEMCSLFSPMNGFDRQELARETAEQVLQLARPAPETPKPATRPAEPVPARRAFFMPRAAAAGKGAV